MGQDHSHSTLEVALLTKPNYCILSEEVNAKNLTLADIVRGIADVICARAERKLNFGTVLIPEVLYIDIV